MESHVPSRRAATKLFTGWEQDNNHCHVRFPHLVMVVESGTKPLIKSHSTAHAAPIFIANKRVLIRAHPPWNPQSTHREKNGATRESKPCTLLHELHPQTVVYRVLVTVGVTIFLVRYISREMCRIDSYSLF
jgi:hypothetical protein